MPACLAWRRRQVGTTQSWCAASRRWRCVTPRALPRPVSCSLRPVGRAQRAPLERLTGATGLFRPEEVALAVELLAAGGRLIVVETSSRADYAPTRTFYERRGYAQAARLRGYYAPADDLVIYLKDLVDGVLARTTA